MTPGSAIQASGPAGRTASAQPTGAAPSIAPGWESALSAWLAAHKHYPEAARRRGDEGSVTLRFTVAADGTVLDVTIVGESGARTLDEAAVALLRGAALPAPQVELTRTVRLHYRLEN